MMTACLFLVLSSGLFNPEVSPECTEVTAEQAVKLAEACKSTGYCDPQFHVSKIPEFGTTLNMFVQGSHLGEVVIALRSATRK